MHRKQDSETRRAIAKELAHRIGARRYPERYSSPLPPPPPVARTTTTTTATPSTDIDPVRTAVAEGLSKEESAPDDDKEEDGGDATESESSPYKRVMIDSLIFVFVLFLVCAAFAGAFAVMIRVCRMCLDAREQYFDSLERQEHMYGACMGYRRLDETDRDAGAGGARPRDGGQKKVRGLSTFYNTTGGRSYTLPTLHEQPQESGSGGGGGTSDNSRRNDRGGDTTMPPPPPPSTTTSTTPPPSPHSLGSRLDEVDLIAAAAAQDYVADQTTTPAPPTKAPRSR